MRALTNAVQADMPSLCKGGCHHRRWFCSPEEMMSEEQHRSLWSDTKSKTAFEDWRLIRSAASALQISTHYADQTVRRRGLWSKYLNTNVKGLSQISFLFLRSNKRQARNCTYKKCTFCVNWADGEAFRIRRGGGESRFFHSRQTPWSHAGSDEKWS